MTILPEAKGKTALVTGASRGIGRALAKGLAEAGFDVAVTDLPSQAAELDVTKGEIEAAGRKAYVYTMDVSKKKDIEATAQALLKAAGSIDVLVNNAGILRPSLLQDLDEANWDAHFDVNAKGVLMMCQAVLPHMRARKSGRVINIASI
ncbi:MAG: SDR family NAD(P)-dependent oxidoreductase, partial [Mesorhizobium sp.]|nr:SDR family NAD(P)-dependent oxidoreductase [Mesorhizobium sp.]